MNIFRNKFETKRNYRRHLKRLILRKKKLLMGPLSSSLVNNFNNVESEPNDIAIADNSNSNSNSDDFVHQNDLNINSDDDLTDQIDENLVNDVTQLVEAVDTANFIKKWSTEFNVKRTAVNSLLKHLHEKVPNIPKDYRTLLQTPQKLQKIEMSGGQYIHIGVKQNIKSYLRTVCRFVPRSITLDFNVDGLPIFKNGIINTFWLILCRINASKVYAVGIFHGSNKPNFEEFLRPFVDEMLQLNYINFKKRKIKIVFGNCICDAPARASVCGTRQFNSKTGCPKCCVEGVFLSGKMTFYRNENVEKRTDHSFRNKLDKNFHILTSPLEVLGINMINNFPLDYLHIVLLGVMKRILRIWFGYKKVRGIFSKEIKDKISAALINLNIYKPSEFHRPLRSLDFINFYNGTQLRTFLLYVGPYVLKNNIPDDLFNNFLYLHVGISILCNKSICITHNEIAKKLLNNFVSEFGELYGEQHIVHNLHCLLHLSDEVLIQNKPLDEFSAFAFENFMTPVKEYIQSHKHPLVQVANRIIELQQTDHIASIKHQKHKDTCLQKKKRGCTDEYDQLILKGYKLNNNSANNKYFISKTGDIYSCRSFYTINNIIYVKCNKFCDKRQPFFENPLHSDKLNIFQYVNQTLGEDETLEISKIDKKVFAMNNIHNNKIVFFPMSNII